MADKVYIEKYNEAYIKIICEEPSVAYELRDFFTFDVPGARFMPSVKAKKWDGKIRLFNVQTGLLYAGLKWYVEKFCDLFGYDINYLSDFSSNENFSLEEAEKFIKNIQDNGWLKMQPRDYQIEGFAHAMRERRAFLLSPTASGKSLIMYLIVRANFVKKCLIIVPTTSLVLQMQTDFIEYGMDPNHIHCIYSGKEKYSNEWITISTWQSIYKLPKSWFKKFGVVLGDEAHGFKAASLKTIMTKLDQCRYRIGVSGTLDGSNTHKLVLEGLFGPIHTVTTMKELMDAGHVSNLKIKCIVLKHPQEIRRAVKKFDYQKEIKALIACPYRNRFIRNLTVSLKSNTLVLFRYIEHGTTLHSYIKRQLEVEPHKRNVYLVHGGVEAEEREIIRKIVEEQDNAIIVASMGTFKMGVNIKRLHNIIFAHPSKDKITILQSIGRTLRLSDDKDHATLYDLCDDFSIKSWKNFTLLHFIERVKLYAEENFNYKIFNIDLKTGE